MPRAIGTSRRVDIATSPSARVSTLSLGILIGQGAAEVILGGFLQEHISCLTVYRLSLGHPDAIYPERPALGLESLSGCGLISG